MSAPFLKERLILASTSKVRSSILSVAGLDHICVPPTVNERDLESHLLSANPTAVSSALASAKAKEVSQRYPDRLVLGADQTLSFENQILHKPADLPEARLCLARLCGKAHELNSAICLVRNGRTAFECVTTARLHMRKFSDEFLDAYLRSAGDAILSSVGCYHIEGVGIHLFEKIEGDQFTIMGLPLLPLLDFLRRDGIAVE